MDEKTDRFSVTILRPETEETPEEVRLGYGMLGKVIADAIRREQGSDERDGLPEIDQES